MALAGGVNLLLSPLIYQGLTRLGMLSPDGRCYAFDRRANGTIDQAVVIRELLQALETEASGTEESS